MSSEKVVIGIDVGTAFSSIGVWDTKLGRARLIADEYGRTRISWAVAFLETHRVIGSGATDEVTENTIFGTKRLIRRKLCDEPSLVEGWPFNVQCKNDFPSVSVRYKNHRKS